MRVAVLFSGGKDSVFAAFACLYSGWEVVLLSVRPAEESTMFHRPNVKWCGMQARAMGMPIKTVKARGKSEKDELLAVKRALKAMKVDAVASGAIESEYQKERIDRIAHELGIRSFAPLWRTGGKLLEEQCRYFDSYLVAVAAEGLNEGMLTRKFDAAFLEYVRKLSPTVSPHLEGGEGETFVANAPFFAKRLKVGGWKRKSRGLSGSAEITSLA
jgi:diphthine-ammonia ligase